MNRPSDQGAWDRHWRSTTVPTSPLGRVASLVRRHLLSRAVRYYAEHYFDEEGVFVECGSGTGQSSQRIPRRRRRLIALDFSALALREAATVSAFTDCVQSDIRRMPFRDESLAGVWNLGVMEHFSEPAVAEILLEFKRVLRPGGTLILFWPPRFGSSRCVLAPVEWCIGRVRATPFHFFPDEVNRLRSKKQAEETLEAVGFTPVAVDFTLRDGFIHVVVVATKPAP